MGTLYIVEMPTSGCDAITDRARQTLLRASLLLAQDTSTARQWLETCGIRTPLAQVGRVQTTLDALRRGDVALLAPTLRLPHAWVRSLIEQGISPVPIPGPVTEITALILSGLPVDRFTFLGRLPAARQARRQALHAVQCERRTLLCTASTQTWAEVQRDLLDILGDRRAALYQPETLWRGRIGQAPTTWRDTPPPVIVIAGASTSPPVWSTSRVREQIRAMQADHLSRRDIARQIAARSGWKKRRVYALLVESDQI